VSDGQETVSLPAFSVTVTAVQAAQPGGFTLNWSAPTTRADGSPLSLADIDGYRIYFGNSRGNYSDVVDVPDGSAQSANVTDIPAGTYYLVMTTYDNTGLESRYSAEISKVAQ
jgi:fibronectin type 3 domain-containing protein